MQRILFTFFYSCSPLCAKGPLPMKNHKLERIFLFTLASLLLSGLAFCKNTHAEDPLAAVKNSIQAKLDGGASVAEAVAQIVKAVADDKKAESYADTTTAAIEMGLNAQEVIASIIDSGGDPLAVGNAAYNAGANLHDIYMAGGSTSGGTAGLQYSADEYGVEQPTDRPASPFVPRDNDDIRFGFTDGG